MTIDGSMQQQQINKIDRPKSPTVPSDQALEVAVAVFDAVADNPRQFFQRDEAPRHEIVRLTRPVQVFLVDSIDDIDSLGDARSARWRTVLFDGDKPHKTIDVQVSHKGVRVSNVQSAASLWAAYTVLERNQRKIDSIQDARDGSIYGKPLQGAYLHGRQLFWETGSLRSERAFNFKPAVDQSVFVDARSLNAQVLLFDLETDRPHAMVIRNGTLDVQAARAFRAEDVLRRMAELLPQV